MPANLTPEYFEAEREYRAATGIEDRLEALERMLSVMPKHKGTDHLRAELTAKISKLREQLDQIPPGARKRGGFHVRREGAGQVALAGLTNCGKSHLVASLTGVVTNIGDFPFITQEPLPAMMRFENVPVQLVDMPAVNYEEARPWLASVLRSANVLLLVVDLAGDATAQMSELIDALKALRLEVAGTAPAAQGGAPAAKRALVAANKSDMPVAGDSLARLLAAWGDKFCIVPVSAERMTNLEELKKAVFESLGVIRVYTKAPGEEASLSSPTVLPEHSTVRDVAALVHKELLAGLKFAQVWGSAKFPGQKVSRDYVLQDGDIVELHT